jgi:membrane protein implicated in regulation of membrane protease activity
VHPQPPGSKGTVERPYSALNLRLALAIFGLVTSAGFAVLAFRTGWVAAGWILAALALIAAIDIVVIQLRRRARRRVQGPGQSLFE